MGDVPYTMVGRVARVRVADCRGLDDMTRRVKEAIRDAAVNGVDKMLVDIAAVTADPPTLSERHWAMTEWAAVGHGVVRVAVFVRPDFHDPEGYGAAVASSHGFQLRGFTDEAEAIAWLDDG